MDGRPGFTYRSFAKALMLHAVSRWLTICLGVLIVYGNLAVAFEPQRIGLRGWPALPVPRLLYDAMLMPGVFGGYSLQNYDFFLLGRRSDRGRAADRGASIRLDLREHFPLREAITYAILFVPHQRDLYGASEQRRAWGSLARRIKARHLRLHPDAPLAALRIGIDVFPQSPLGYRALKQPGKIWTQLLYAEP
jgi:hypothetical protein